VPHVVTVDPTLHWANPPGGNAGRDTRPTFTSTPPPYRGPVPNVVHLHGAHVNEESDGYPEAWFLPTARNVPSGFATVGSFYNRYKAEFAGRTGVNWAAGTSTYQYRNDQRATTLWYHDHVLGMTRTNIYAGLSGFYLLRGGSSDLPAGVLPGPAPQVGDAAGTRYHEIPLMLQCRSFNSDGSLFFPTSRDFFGDATPGGPFIPDTDLSPYWNPEFFGNTITVNGNTWPTLNVEARRYRFRIVNASNTRVFMLKIVTNPTATRPVSPTLPMWVIGSDGGFLPRPVQQGRLTVAVAERYDVIVDFTGVRPGTQLFLINEGPDEPFGGGEPVTDFDPADPGTTGQVMRFVVGAPASTDYSVPPTQLSLPSAAPIGAASRTRRVSLNEMDSATFPDAPTMGMLGTLNSDGTPNPLLWSSAVSENPALNATEVWELHNFTEDAHPIHVHLVQFQVLSRQPFDGAARGPEATEIGFKDTVIALPGEITRIKARFDIAGRYVWHCHIIDHEDNEMMRPYQVGG
jgi:bilirubin oxidase